MRLDRLEIVVILAMATIIIYQLFVPPVIGVADNGDYDRVMEPLGLERTVTSWTDSYFDHVNLAYKVGAPREMEFPTSLIVQGKASLAVNKLLNADSRFDLRILGGINTALYLVGLTLILLHLRRLSRTARIVGCLFLLFAATDVSNISFFNSFYSESASLIYFTLLIGCFLTINRQPRIQAWHILVFFAVAALFVAAKPQNHPLAIPVVLITVIWLWRKPRALNIGAVLVGGLAIVIFAGALYTSVPEDVKGYNRWNALFYSLLNDSPDARTDLSELGMDPELAVFAGRSAFEEGMPVFETTENFDHAELAKFYLKHPGRFVSLASACAREIYVKMDPVNGHFEKSSGLPARHQSGTFGLWYQFQATALPRSLGWLIFLGVCLVAAAGYALRHYGPASEEGSIAWLALGLGLMAAMEFGVCVLGDGTYDIVKHLFLFQVLLDACFLIAVTWLAGSAKEMLQKLTG